MGKIEILTGPERRRRWSAEQKLEILAEASAAGVSIAEVARRHDVLPQQIYAWRCKARAEHGRSEADAQASPPFIEVPIGDAPAKPSVDSAVPELIITLAKGRCLQVSAAIDPDQLRALIRSIEQA